MSNTNEHQKDLIQVVLAAAANTLERIRNPKINQTILPVVRSFNWTGSQAQLEVLCQALKDAGYIHPGTTKEAFIAIFANELIKDKPVQWLGSNRLLSYLFSQMNSGKNPLILSQDWQSIIERYQLFKNKKGKMLKAGDLSTALSNINDVNTGMEPKGHEKIDEILKNIKTLIP